MKAPKTSEHKVCPFQDACTFPSFLSLTSWLLGAFAPQVCFFPRTRTGKPVITKIEKTRQKIFQETKSCIFRSCGIGSKNEGYFIA